ncbi:exoribonuclease RNAse R, partial [mine drainage metagenome]
KAPAPPYESARRDLRQLPLVTIDGEDAHDFDDAVFAEKTKQGFRLIVAIADVSAYVRPGTALDREARRRGTSAYFPDRVIPMLPERLSNDLCSLKPGADRFAYVADLELDARGQSRRAVFYPAVIHSRARLVYEEVAEALEQRKPEARHRLEPVLEALEALYALYRILREAREKRGAIDFETREPRIVFGPDGEFTGIRIRERTDAHRLIEECMILANSEVAKWLEHKKIPALYRVHPPPQAERIADLREVLGNWGITLPGGAQPKPADFARLIQHLGNLPERRVV